MIKMEHPDKPIIISTAFLEDKRLTWKAKGILVTILSMPNDWKLNIEDIAKHATDGVAAIKSGVQELISLGYIEKKEFRDKKGKIIQTEYVVYEDLTTKEKS